ncbi:MAG: response regulator [Deltaproteobacteria bacterium]|nr:response regulator [Deltaproteobacteria bacterium]
MTETPAPQQEPPETSPPPGSRPRVLIVDASELGGLLQALLTRNDIDAVLVRTGAAALDAILGAPPMLAIVDLDLPDASGVDLVHILRQPPENVPVVFLCSTAKEALPENTQRGVELAQGFFQKPLHARQLLQHVSRLLGIAQFPSYTPPSGVPIPTEEHGSTVLPTAPAPGTAPLPESDFELDVTDALVEEEEAPESPPAQTAAAADAAPPPEHDPTDLMAMWMRKREDQRTGPAATAPAAAPPPTSGSLDERPLHGLLDAFYSASESGTLLLRRGPVIRKLGVARGQVALATSNVAAEQPDAVVAHLGLVTPTLLEAARQQLPRGKALVPHLVAAGLLTREQAVKVLEEQRTRVVRACFLMKGAAYELQFGATPPSPLTPLFMGTAILRGLGSSMTLVELRREIPATQVLAPRGDGPYPLERLDLSGAEAHLVIACDGTKTVADLEALSDLSELQVLGLLRGLLALKLVRLQAAAPATRANKGFTFF